MRRVCCVCRKTHCGGRWVSLPIDDSGPVTHGYCPACYGVAMAKIQAIINERDKADTAVNTAMHLCSPLRQEVPCV